MTDLAFHPVVDADIAEVVDLWERCGLTRPWNDPVGDIAFARGRPGSEVLAARLEGRLVASVLVGHDGHRGTVYYVSVCPEHRGRGYGRDVMRAAEAWLSARGVWKLNLLIRAENEAARDFYAALGYEVEPRTCMARRLAG